MSEEIQNTDTKKKQIPTVAVPSTKGKVAIKGPIGSDPQRAKAASAARAAVLKATGQKSISFNPAPLAAVSSGSSLIDDVIGGTLADDKSGPVCPGYPRRFITEIYGAESSGKTTAALQAIAEVQKQGGLAMFLDFEHALNHKYAKAVGVNFDEDKLLLFQPENLEQGWKMLYLGLKTGVDLVVVDSVSSMVPKEEMEKKLDDPARIGALARAMSLMLPKICMWLHSKDHSTNPLGTALVFINQTRAIISANARGDMDNTSGGKALKFYAYLRLKFSRIRSEILKKKDRFSGKERSYPIGNHTQVKIVKSKVDGKQGYTTDIFIRYGQGIDDYYSMIEAAANNKVIGKSGAFYSYAGEQFQGRDKLRNYLLENPKVFSEIRVKVLNAVRDDRLVTEADLEDEDSIIESLDAALGDSDEATSEAPEELVIEETE